MSASVFHLRHLFLATFAATLTTATIAASQESTHTSANVGNLLNEVSLSFAKDKVIPGVQLAGYAFWYAGSLQDSGTVELVILSNGSSKMELSLSSSGLRTESQLANRSFQWTGNDSVAHEITSGSCARPISWTLPALSLQRMQSINSAVNSDLGLGVVGSGQEVYRHIRSATMPIGSLPADIVADIVKQSLTDVGLDQRSLLPQVLAYSTHPDNGMNGGAKIDHKSARERGLVAG